MRSLNSKSPMTRKGDVGTQIRKPVHILALAGLIGVCVLFFFLGKWQWDRTQDILNAERAAAAQSVPVSEILEKDLAPENFGRTVTASGQYISDRQARVFNRFENGAQDARTGEWIVSEFALDSGESIAVLRGWVEPGGEFSTPQGAVTVTGVIQPNEAFYQGALAESSGVVVIDSVQLGQIWGSDLSDGFIVLTSQVPQDASAPVPVPPTISTSDVPFPLQNFFYAIQWWIFALFAVVLYARWIWVSARQNSTAEALD